MQSSGSSKRASRKSRLFAVISLFSLACCSIPAAAAQGALLSAYLDDDRAVVSLEMVETSEKILVKNAYDGQVAKVTFDLRIYRHSRGLSGLLGDRIILEKQLEKYGRWDAFTGRFEIEDSDGSIWTTSRADEYTGKLLSLSGVSIPGSWDRDNSYLLARISLKRILLQIPFNLLDPFLEETRIRTPWVRWDFSFGADRL
jgi:hypothetical protein